MAEKNVTLDPDLKAVDDARTSEQKYLVEIREGKDGTRRLVFEDYSIFTSRLPATERFAKSAELMTFMAARIKRLETQVKLFGDRVIALEAKP